MVDIYIHYLRDKIDQSSSCPLIKTVRGVGHKIEAWHDSKGATTCAEAYLPGGLLLAG